MARMPKASRCRARPSVGGALVEWLAQQAPCLIGMEACGGAHHLARVLIDCGHTVRLIHPSFVKAYVKSNKNDFRDAEAIAEAVTRPTMRFVAIKTVAQQEPQALHRLRSGAVTQRTAVINQIGLLLEFGITVPRGPTALRRHLPEILETVDGGVAALGRDLVAELQREWVHLDERIAALEQRLRQQTRTSEPCRRLRTIPGIGVLGASAFVAAFGDGRQLASGRDCAAALGLVPRQTAPVAGRNLAASANGAIPTSWPCSSTARGLCCATPTGMTIHAAAGSGRSRSGVGFRWPPWRWPTKWPGPPGRC